jgi:hypothetical protein
MLTLADSPASAEYLIEENNLEPQLTEKALEGLLQKGLIYYPDGYSDYTYAVWIPEEQ